jgi:hypothetical protein
VGHAGGYRPWVDRLAVVACAGHGSNLMEDHVYRLSEVVGTSSEGVARANRTLRNPGLVPGLRDPRHLREIGRIAR